MEFKEDYGGIYRITNNINNKVYIGSSIHVNKRIKEHKLALTRKDHQNFHLQSAWNKYGEENFSFEIIEIIDDAIEIIRQREQYWIDYYQSYDQNVGYNISHYAVGSGGYEISEETKEKIRLAHIGKKHSEETKRKLSEQRIGELNNFYGKTHTEESRKIMSEKAKQRDKSTFNTTGLKHGKDCWTEETYKKLSEANRGENSGTSKLTEENVIDILKMIQNGYTYLEIRNKYDISDSEISRIKNKIRWGYLYEKFPELYDFPKFPKNNRMSPRNTSGVIGVGWAKKRNKWVASITIDGKLKHLGYFNDKQDAIKARLIAEFKIFGMLSPQKHLFDEYQINIQEEENDGI